MKRIRFHEQHPARWFRNRTFMKDALLRLFKKEGHELEQLDVIFCSDAFLLNLNQEYLGHDTYTDIITFDLSNRKKIAVLGKKLPIIGELYISIDRIQENARQFQADRQTELNRVIFHGCLHLCGFGDKKKHEKELMKAKEEEYIKRYARNLPR
ncbi:MAG: rRNA maturation RNase YbeY [Bacteroidota bacterium]